MRQRKQEHKCPKCGAAVKRVIGPVSRKKFWVCTRDGEACYMVQAGA